MDQDLEMIRGRRSKACDGVGFFGGCPPGEIDASYFLYSSIAAAAAACCFAASCPVAYFCTAKVTPKLIEISSVKPKRKRVNELRGLDCMGLLYTNFDLYCRYPCAKCL